MARRTGFTLPEMLIAATIGAVALGLTLRAFGEVQKLMAASRSKGESQAYATEAVAKLADMFRKAHVFYYSARPLREQAAAVTGRATEPAPRDGVPPALLDFGATTNTWRPPADVDKLPDFNAWRAQSQVSKRVFRFTDPAPDGVEQFKLGVAPARRTGASGEDHFPGPLAYFAVADFVKTNTGDTANERALLPRTWTFHLLYLCPMALPPNDPNIAEPNNPRDQLPPPIPADRKPGRTAVPYELRMLTIPGVIAGAPAPPGGSFNIQPGGFSAHAGRYDPQVGRLVAPNLRPGETAFLEPPFDYDGTAADRQANYDPLPIPMTANPAGFLEPVGNNVYRFRGPAGEQLGRPASGPRVAGGGIHANFNMIGNDPPTDLALRRTDPAAGQPTDKLIVAYVDPDAATGTVCRFVNNMREAPAAAAGPDGQITIPTTTNTYRRYIDMIGQGCDYLENRYQSRWNDNASDTSTGAYGALPERALVSVSIRYRTRKDVPFQFATIQNEVPLDGVAAFDKIRPRR